MMKKFTVILMVIFTGVLSAQYTAPESGVYSVFTDSYFISDAGSGKIFAMDVEGNVSEFNSELNSPKGLFLEYEQYLWAADNKQLRKIDAFTGELIETFDIEGSGMLNDITGDNLGTLFITDTQTGNIYSFDTGNNEYEVLNSEDINAPNGIYYYYYADILLVCSFGNDGKIWSLDLNGNANEITNTGFGRLDGITMRETDNKLYFSSWGTGTVYSSDISFEPDIKISDINALKENLNGPADIFYNQFNETLLIPAMNDATVEIHQFDPRPAEPNDVIYYEKDDEIYISNYITQKILSTDKELDNYETFHRFDLPVVALAKSNNILFASTGNNVYRFDLEQNEMTGQFESEHYIHGLTAVSDNTAMGLTRGEYMSIFEFQEKNVEVQEAPDGVVAYTLEEKNAYFIKAGDVKTPMLYKKNAEEIGDTSVIIPSYNYHKILVYDKMIYIPYNSNTEEKAGIMVFNSTLTESFDFEVEYSSDKSNFPASLSPLGNDQFVVVFPVINDVRIMTITESGVKWIKNNSFDIYPNPADKTINIENNSLNAEYMIYDIKGNLILNGKANNSINVEELEKGSYFIIINDNGETKTAKFIKK